jgi:predicted dienelactone hydrolase
VKRGVPVRLTSRRLNEGRAALPLERETLIMSPSTYAADTVGAPTSVLSVSPVVLPAPGRAVDLQVRVSAPVTGGELPIILLSHGHGPSNNLSSLNGYAPLADFWAAHGFVVIQPTHLDSRTLSLDSDDPEAPLYWRSRAEDMKRILDRLDAIEAAVPRLLGRLDRSKVAVAGHSMGGHTASLLLGARLIDPHDGTEVNLVEPRIKAGVLLAAPGRGGDALTGFVAENYPFMSSIDFSEMTTPALVVAGDKDTSPHLTVMGADWHTDPYLLAPGRKSLLTLFDGEHGLGGVSGYDVAETTDENPARVAAVQRLTWAYLRSELYPGDPAWQKACDELTAGPDPLGRVESK